MDDQPKLTLENSIELQCLVAMIVSYINGIVAQGEFADTVEERIEYGRGAIYDFATEFKKTFSHWQPEHKKHFGPTVQ